jgi:hypothetical protein
VTKNKNNSTAREEEEEKPRKKKKPRARGKHCVPVKEPFGEIMATMAAAATTLGRLTTTQEAAALASLRSYPSSSPLLCAAFSHSKFAHGATTTVIGTCWRGEQPGRKWEQVLRQSSRGSRRGGALLCMSSISLGTKETATSSDSLFSNFKPSTAFFFPGQVNKLERMDASL